MLRTKYEGIVSHLFTSPVNSYLCILNPFRTSADCLKSFVGRERPVNNIYHLHPLWF
jgi:hypothetical protein